MQLKKDSDVFLESFWRLPTLAEGGALNILDAASTLRENLTSCPLGYERVYLQFCKVAGSPFYIQGDEVSCLIE